MANEETGVGEPEGTASGYSVPIGSGTVYDRINRQSKEATKPVSQRQAAQRCIEYRIEQAKEDRKNARGLKRGWRHWLIRFAISLVTYVAGNVIAVAGLFFGPGSPAGWILVIAGVALFIYSFVELFGGLITKKVFKV